MTFFHGHCVFQELGTQMTIGTERESGGLYHLERDTEAIAYSNFIPYSDAHCQLGHPSLQNFKIIVLTLSYVSSLDCESRQLGKHYRISYRL